MLFMQFGQKHCHQFDAYLVMTSLKGTLAKVLCKPHFEKSHLVTGHCETGKSKSARIGPYFKF